MSQDISSIPKSVYIAELVGAAALGYLSFGAHCHAEREKALAAELGPTHPAYSVVMDRVPLPVGFAKLFGVGAVCLAGMGIRGIAQAKKTEQQ